MKTEWPGAAWLRAAAAGLAGMLAVAGCDTDTTPDPNIPPQTFLTGGPVEASRVAHHVEFNWRGADIDGTTREYDYIMETQAPGIATYDQITVQTPAVDDGRWTRIDAASRTFVLPADVLRVPVTSPPPLQFDRWHTFWVRSVDNDGAVDDTPEHVTFQTFTEAPDMALELPAQAGITVTLPRTFAMNWTGTDPIGATDDTQDPKEARWIMLDATLDGSGRPLGFPDSLYALADSRWQPFRDWGTVQGRSAVLRNLTLAGPGTRTIVFAIQGRDDGGAVTPLFSEDGVANNYTTIRVDGALDVGPRMHMFAAHTTVDTLDFLGGSPAAVTISTAADSVAMSWNQPDASRYGAVARECRFGWNLLDVSDDDLWTEWEPTSRSAPRRRILNNDIFYCQCRDDLGRGDHTQDLITTVRITFLDTGP